MTYTVSSGTLNPTQLQLNIRSLAVMVMLSVFVSLSYDCMRLFICIFDVTKVTDIGVAIVRSGEGFSKPGPPTFRGSKRHQKHH